jgi:hypothetical protein
MIYNKLKKFGQEKGWYRTERSVFGMHNGYFFNIYQGNMMSSPQYKTIICRTEAMLESQVFELEQLLTENKKSIKYDLLEVGIDFISITFHENFSFTKAAKLDETLNIISKELSDRNIKSKYNYSEKMDYYNLSGEGVLLSQKDFINQSSKIGQMEAMDKLENHSYFNGFIGTIIYSLPIIILWVLLAVYAERLSSGMGMLVALTGSFGYEKFKGKLGFWSKWIILLSNIALIFLANVGVIAFILWRMSVPFDQMLDLFKTDFELQSFFKTNLLISIVIGAVGWFWLLFNFNTKRNYIEKAEKL